jgi:hypothetical protein
MSLDCFNGIEIPVKYCSTPMINNYCLYIVDGDVGWPGTLSLGFRFQQKAFSNDILFCTNRTKTHNTIFEHFTVDHTISPDGDVLHSNHNTSGFPIDIKPQKPESRRDRQQASVILRRVVKLLWYISSKITQRGRTLLVVCCGTQDIFDKPDSSLRAVGVDPEKIRHLMFLTNGHSFAETFKMAGNGCSVERSVTAPPSSDHGLRVELVAIS